MNAPNGLRTEFTILTLFATALILWILGLIPASIQREVLLVITIIGIVPVIKSAWESLVERKFNVDLLAAIALIFALLAGEWGPLLFINLMLSSARILGIYTERRVRTSLESLIKLKPSKARILRNSHSVEVSLGEVHVGDLVIVNIGEQIPVDGVVIDGTATVNQSSLTGESMPVLRTIDDLALAATVVASGHLTIRAKRVGAQTTFERMIALVESSQRAKTRMKTTAERFASWYIGIMLTVSVILYVATNDIGLVLAVILVVCADDIAIAIPLAYVVSIGTAARRGIIIKSADFLERAAKITTLIVDKTGTLTMGDLSVNKVYPFGAFTTRNLLEIAHAACKNSKHPVSKAITAYAKEQSIQDIEPEHIEEFEGRGIKGSKNGHEILVGRIEFLREQGITITDAALHNLKEVERNGSNATFIVQSGIIVGLVSLTDQIREGVPETIAELRKDGVGKTIMLTGDSEIAAEQIARRAGVSEYHARLLPEHKVSYLSTYLGKGKTVAMVGDGVNDAAVITRADIGIAMGTIGTDAAIESADIVLMKDDFRKLSELRTIARNVLSVAHQNFALWAIINSVGLYFVFTGVFDPSRAAAYNFLTDFIPIFNSLRLFRYRDS